MTVWYCLVPLGLQILHTRTNLQRRANIRGELTMDWGDFL